MGLTFNLGRVSPSVFTDSSLNVGIGAAPSGSYKLDVSGTGRFTGSTILASTSGNVGIGIVPSTWNSIFVGIDFVNKGGVNSYTNYLALSQNMYYGTGALDGWRYKSTGYAAAINLESSSGNIVLRNTSTSGTADAALSWQDRMTITSAGNVGIGTSPSYRLVVNSGTDGISAGIAGSTYGIRFDNGGSFSSGMSTIHGVDSTLTGSYQPIMINGSDVRFGTSATERMRITSGGQIYTSNAPVGDWSMRVIGSSSTSNSYGFKVLGGTNSSDLAFSVTPQNGSVNYFFIRGDGYMCSLNTYNNTTANAANVSISSSGFFERSTSSIRFKTEVEDLTIDTSSILSKMRPIWYRSLGENDKKEWSWYGFIAEELAEIEPRLVQWGYDKTSYEIVETKDEEGNIKKETKLKEDAVLIPDGVQYERISVLLVAEIQKMNQTIQELSNRLIKAGL